MPQLVQYTAEPCDRRSSTRSDLDVTGSGKIYCASHAAWVLKDCYRGAASVLFERLIETSDEGVTDSLYL
jgi:hypothetical protein